MSVPTTGRTESPGQLATPTTGALPPAQPGMTRRQYRAYLQELENQLGEVAVAPETPVAPVVPLAAETPSFDDAPTYARIAAPVASAALAFDPAPAPTTSAFKYDALFPAATPAPQAPAQFSAAPVPPVAEDYLPAWEYDNSSVAEAFSAGLTNDAVSDGGPDWSAADDVPSEWLSVDSTPTMSRRALRQPATTSTGRLVAVEALRVSTDALRKPLTTLRTAGMSKVGFAGALGVVSVVTPVMTYNAIGDSGDTANANTTMVLSAGQQPQLPDSVSPAAPAGPAASVPTLQAQPLPVVDTAIRVDQAVSRAADAGRSPLPNCVDKPTHIAGSNGRLPKDDLCKLWSDGHYLRSDAAIALARLNEAYKAKFGHDLSLTDSYRSYAAQVAVRRSKPGLAAKPGTSEHGWGLAVDLGGSIPDAGSEYRWMRENAPKFGWDNPSWARSGGRGPYEPWHWEYVAGQGA